MENESGRWKTHSTASTQDSEIPHPGGVEVVSEGNSQRFRRSLNPTKIHKDQEIIVQKHM